MAKIIGLSVNCLLGEKKPTTQNCGWLGCSWCAAFLVQVLSGEVHGESFLRGFSNLLRSSDMTKFSITSVVLKIS